MGCRVLSRLRSVRTGCVGGGRVLLPLVVVAALALSKQGSLRAYAGSAGGGKQVVAELELDAPTAQVFFLRATLPLPPGTWRPGDRRQPLGVLDPRGLMLETQCEVVTRHARAQDGAAVVEIVARVRRPRGVQPGERLRYRVVYFPHPGGRRHNDKHLRKLLAQPGALTLETRDVFGNRYRADLFAQVLEGKSGSHMTKRGPLLAQYRTHSVLLPVEPVEGPKGTLPHMQGVHSYITTYDRADWFLLDLHVHNGLHGLDKDDPRDDALRAVHFDELALGLPKGWDAVPCFESPAAGESRVEGDRMRLPLIERRADGKLHFMPRQGRLVRRLVVYREGSRRAALAAARQEGLAFCVDGASPSGERLWSWWNKATAGYFPQRHRLPDLSFVGLANMRAGLEQELDLRSAQVAAGSPGSYPLKSPALGWAQPWGVPYGGMTGGDEINLVDGLRTAAAASRAGYRLAQLRARSYTDRQPTALYSLGGEPTRYEDLLVLEGQGAPYVNATFYIVPSASSDPFGFEEAPTFQLEAVAALGLEPPYQAELEQWMPIDIQHYVRHSNNWKILAWLGNDMLARDQLTAAAEIFRLGYHAYANSSYGYVQGSGLRSCIDHVAEFPGQGLDFQRSEGWGIDVAVAAYALGSKDLRARFYGWFESIAQVVAQGQSDCTGNLMATKVGKMLDGEVYVRLVGHSSYADNALASMRKSVFQGRDDSRADQLAEALVGNAQAQCSPAYWSEEHGAPWTWVGVGLVDEVGDWCDEIPQWAKAETTNDVGYSNSFALAFELSGNPEFLFRAAQMLGGGDLLGILEARGLDRIETTAALLALAQEPSQ